MIIMRRKSYWDDEFFFGDMMMSRLFFGADKDDLMVDISWHAVASDGVFFYETKTMRETNCARISDIKEMAQAKYFFTYRLDR